MRKLFILAVACGLFSACSDDKYVGDEPVSNQGNNLITIGTNNIAVTRASLETLEGSMLVYGTKLNSGVYTTVFGNYAVWNTATSASETGTWDYIADKDTKISVIADGELGTNNLTVPQWQIAKYWDYDATDYLFWAVAPYSTDVSFTTASNVAIYSTVTGVGAHLAAVETAGTYKKFYLANPVRKVQSNEDYSTTSDGTDKPVTFSFEQLGAKVRVGFYETINNYKVIDIKFYCDENSTHDGQNICLNRTDDAFVGGAGSASTSAKVTYDNTNLTYTVDSYKGLTAQKWIQFGKLDLSESAALSTSSSVPSYGTDGDMDDNKYIIVMPTPVSNADTNSKPITINMDFTVKGEDADAEEITIHGATATIPAQYSSWKNNCAYTYVFKISDNTSGSQHGLYPIVFDAEASTMTSEQDGTTTQMAGTSITTYQDGSAVASGVIYQADKDIIAYFLQGTTYITPSSSNVKVLQMDVNNLYDSSVTTNYQDITSKVTFDATNKTLTIGKANVKSAQDLVIIYTDASDTNKSATKIVNL